MASHETMQSSNRGARITGVLFIMATAAGILSMVLLGSILDAPDHLAQVGASSARIITAALLDLLMVAAIFAIPVALFPDLKQQGTGSALAYLVARIFEAVPILVGVISLLLLVTLGRESLAAGAADAPYFQTLGSLLLAARDWTDIIGTQIVFSLTALILNYSLYRARLIPRWLSIWGLVGALLILVAGLMSMYGLLGPFSTAAILMYLPIALQEMVFAVRLIVKGFSR